MDIGACLKDSWEALKRYPGPLLIGSWTILLLAGIAQGLLAAHATGGITLLALKALHGQEPEIGAVFRPFERFIDYLMVFLCVLAGLLFFGIGIFVTSILFVFAPIAIAADGVDWKTALGHSASLVMGNLPDVLLLIVALTGINIIGSLLCFVGLLLTVPFTYVATVRAYEQLSRASSGAS